MDNGPIANQLNMNVPKCLSSGALALTRLLSYFAN